MDICNLLFSDTSLHQGTLLWSA